MCINCHCGLDPQSPEFQPIAACAAMTKMIKNNTKLKYIMKKSILLSMMLAFSIALFAQEKKNVEFTEITHNFGTVQEGAGDGGKITAVFVFKNLGTTPVFIESAKTSCGCTTPKVDDKKPILPNAIGKIPVVYNTNGRQGKFNKSISITFKDGSDNSFTKVVYIKGEVTAKPQPQQKKKN